MDKENFQRVKKRYKVGYFHLFFFFFIWLSRMVFCSYGVHKKRENEEVHDHQCTCELANSLAPGGSLRIFLSGVQYSGVPWV